MTTPTSPDSQTQEDDFVLDPPAAVRIPTTTQAQKTLAPLAQEQRAAVDEKILARVDSFVERVSNADLQSDQFRDMLQRAFSAGRSEITDTSNFIAKNPLLGKATFKDYSDSQAAQALRELSKLLAKANPKGRDLLGAPRVLGVPVPFGSKLRSYMDDFKPIGARINELIEVLVAEEDAQQMEIAGYDVTEGQMFEKLQRLDRASEYLSLLDQRLEAQASALAATQPDKARALREEVLYFVRLNLSDVGAHKLLVVAGIGQMRQLRHTGRMTLHGMQRVRTLGADALAIAQAVAIAAYNQKKRMQLNRQAQSVVNEVVAGLGDVIEQHTDDVIDFASNPVLGLSSLEASIDKTLGAIQKLNEFRSLAVDTLSADNVKLRDLYETSKSAMRIDSGTSPSKRLSSSPPQAGAFGDVFSL